MNIPKVLGIGFLSNNTNGWVPNGTLWMLYKFDVSGLYMTGDIWIFKLFISKFMVILLLWASQNWLYLFVLTEFGPATFILLSLGKMLGRGKQSKPTLFDKKFKNDAWDLAQVIFNESVNENQELGSQLRNKLFLNMFFLTCMTK